MEGNQEEEKGKDVFPFSNPGNGFDTERVEGPEQGEEKRRKGAFGKPEEEGKEQKGVQRMEGGVD